MTRKGILALATMLFVLLREQMIPEVQSADFADGQINEPLKQADPSGVENFAEEGRRRCKLLDTPEGLAARFVDLSPTQACCRKVGEPLKPGADQNARSERVD